MAQSRLLLRGFSVCFEMGKLHGFPRPILSTKHPSLRNGCFVGKVKFPLLPCEIVVNNFNHLLTNITDLTHNLLCGYKVIFWETLDRITN